MLGSIADYRSNRHFRQISRHIEDSSPQPPARLSDKTRAAHEYLPFCSTWFCWSSASCHGLNCFRRSAGAHQMLLGLNDNGLRDGRPACAEREKQRGDFKESTTPAKVHD